MFQQYVEGNSQRRPHVECCGHGGQAAYRVRRGPTPLPRLSSSWQNRRCSSLDGHRMRTKPKIKRTIDAEFGKAHHMRVARCRHHRSRRYPAPIRTTPQPYPYPWPIPSHVQHGPWLWLGNRCKSWGAKALSPISESCGLDRLLAVNCTKSSRTVELTACVPVCGVCR